jgi:hypothetical protein
MTPLNRIVIHIKLTLMRFTRLIQSIINSLGWSSSTINTQLIFALALISWNKLSEAASLAD